MARRAYTGSTPQLIPGFRMMDWVMMFFIFIAGACLPSPARPLSPRPQGRRTPVQRPKPKHQTCSLPPTHTTTTTHPPPHPFPLYVGWSVFPGPRSHRRRETACIVPSPEESILSCTPFPSEPRLVFRFRPLPTCQLQRPRRGLQLQRPRRGLQLQGDVQRLGLQSRALCLGHWRHTPCLPVALRESRGLHFPLGRWGLSWCPSAHKET